MINLVLADHYLRQQSSQLHWIPGPPLGIQGIIFAAITFLSVSYGNEKEHDVSYDHGGSMLPQTRILPKTPKKILSGSSRPGLFSHDSKPHPLLAPFYSAVAGLTFFFLLMFFQVTLIAHIFWINKIQVLSEISIESGFLSLLPDWKQFCSSETFSLLTNVPTEYSGFRRECFHTSEQP